MRIKSLLFCLPFSLWTSLRQRRRFAPNATPPPNWETSITATYGGKDGCNSSKSSPRRERWAAEFGLFWEGCRRNHSCHILSESQKIGSGIRPWKRVYSVLQSHSLFLYKDKREAVLRGASIEGGAEDEQPISIRGCLVDIAYSETKRKHALRLTTQDFCEYLLQAEDREDMLEWIKVIRESNKMDSEVRGHTTVRFTSVLCFICSDLWEISHVHVCFLQELGSSRQALINKKLNDYRKQR